MLKPLLSFATAGLLLAGCASTPSNTSTVIQRENNQFEVTGIGSTQLAAQNNAAAAANKACKSSSAVVVNQQVKYNGVVDEKTGRMIDQAAGVVGILTGTKTSKISRDDDYQVSLTFYCKA